MKDTDTITVTVEIPVSLAHYCLIDYFPPYPEEDFKSWDFINYADSGTLLAGVRAANVIAQSIPREVKVQLLGEEWVAYREKNPRQVYIDKEIEYHDSNDVR